MLSDTQIDRIVDNVMNTGGATFNASGLFSYLEGFQVGLAGCGGEKDMSQVSPEDVRAVLDPMIGEFSARKWALVEEGFDLGVWLDKSTNVLYFDVTRHYSDCELALKRAGEMGELCIWDWANMCEVPVKLMDKVSGI